MGSDAHDDSLFLPFASALYNSDEIGDTHVFEPLVLVYDDDRNDDANGHSDDNTSELVPLLELVSAEDVERVYAQALDSDDCAAEDLHTQQLSLLHDGFDTLEPQQQQQLILAAGHTTHSSPTRSNAALPPQSVNGITARYLTKKELSGKRALKSKANRARDERRSELIYLRKKVSELEAQLRSVQAKRPRLAAATSSTTRDAVDSANGELALSTLATGSNRQPPQRASARPRYVAHAWEDIASRQSEERVKAERENIRLRLVLENQLKIAKSLERILNKKSTAKDIEEFVERTHVSAPTADASDADVFRALLHDVEQLYFEIDAVFEANGLAQTEAPLTNARVRTDAESGMVLEMFATKVLPFDVHATGTAVWHHFAFAKAHTPFRCYTYSSSQYLHSPEDTVMESFILKLDAKGTDANFRVKQVLRRHIERDRVVVLWRAAFEAFEFSAEPVSGMRFRESGYIVIKRPRSIAGTHSLVQTCYVMTPDFAEELVGSNHPRVGAITDFVLASTATNISSTHQMIENVLLEQAVRARQRSAGASAPAAAVLELLEHQT